MISILGLVAGLSLSTLGVAAPERAVPSDSASALESAVPAIVVTLASDVVSKTNIADLKGEMKKKPKKSKPTKLNVVHSPEIDAKAGGQAIALIIGVMLLGFERVRRITRN